jgi:hypothetical protein
MYLTEVNSSQSPKINPAAPKPAAAPKQKAVAAPPTQDNRITISICTLSAQQFDFEFNLSDTVKTVKEKIQEESANKNQKILLEQRRLIFGERTLFDNETLSSISGNKDGFKIQLTLLIRSKEVAEAIKRVQHNGLALRLASEELRGDREVVQAAVNQDGRALR